LAADSSRVFSGCVRYADDLIAGFEHVLARSGEITEPWPVPLSLTVTTPSSRTPALSLSGSGG
jgi:hypothetical protein